MKNLILVLLLTVLFTSTFAGWDIISKVKNGVKKLETKLKKINLPKVDVKSWTQNQHARGKRPPIYQKEEIPKKSGFLSTLKNVVKNTKKSIVEDIKQVKKQGLKKTIDRVKSTAKRVIKAAKEGGIKKSLLEAITDYTNMDGRQAALDGATDEDFESSPVSPRNFESLKKIIALAYSTYCDNSALDHFTCWHCKRFTEKLIKFKRITSKGDYNSVLVGETHDYNFIAFRGSKSRTESLGGIKVGIQNWLTNLDSELVHFAGAPKNCKVHNGLYDAYKTLKVNSFRYLKSLPQKRLIVTGHSRGGAIAHMAAYDLKKQGYNLDVVTFGSPRISNKEFVVEYTKHLKDHSYRVVNSGDFIPHTPIIKFGYRSLPNEIWIDKNGRFNFCRFAPEMPWVQDPKCSMKLDGSQLSDSDHSYYMGFDVRAGQKHNC